MPFLSYALFFLHHATGTPPTEQFLVHLEGSLMYKELATLKHHDSA